MKLKEGMYVRTKYNDFCNMVAIRKIEELDEEDNKFWIDDYIIDTYGDDQNKLCKEDISKASNNIIDLIEVGDYVNGRKVIKIIEKNIFDNKNVLCSDDDLLKITDRVMRYVYTNDGIKSIVTKEQFEIMEYKVNE